MRKLRPRITTCEFLALCWHLPLEPHTVSPLPQCDPLDHLVSGLHHRTSHLPTPPPSLLPSLLCCSLPTSQPFHFGEIKSRLPSLKVPRATVSEDTTEHRRRKEEKEKKKEERRVKSERPRTKKGRKHSCPAGPRKPFPCDWPGNSFQNPTGLQHVCWDCCSRQGAILVLPPGGDYLP